MKKLLLIMLCCLCLSGCTSNNNETPDNNQTNGNENNNSTTNNNESTDYSINKAFIFDDLEITISDDYSFDTIDNMFSEYDNQVVIKVPVTVKNLKDETHSLNMFYYSFFGSQGTELNTVASYFDDSIDFAGDLRKDASYTKYFYILYDGDGTYTIEFDDWTDKISIDIEVTRQ